MSIPSSSWAMEWDVLMTVRLSDLQTDTILGTGSPTQRANLLEHLELERRALLDVINDVTHLRNACAPINVLPPELLIHIFALVTSSNPTTWRVQGAHDEIHEQRLGGGNVVSRQPITVLTDKTSFYAKESPSRIPFPHILPCLRELSLISLTGLYLDETMDLLNRTPLVEILVIRSCSWADASPTQLSTPVINLSKLRALSLATSYSKSPDGSYDNTSLRNIYPSLRFPKRVVISLSPKFTMEEALSASGINLLRELFERALGDFDFSAHAIGIHVSDDSAGKELSFAILPTDRQMPTGHPLMERYAVRRAKIDVHNFPLDVVFNDPGIAHFVKATTMLAIDANSKARSPEDRFLLHSTLFRAFPGLQALQVLAPPRLLGCALVWEFLSRLVPDVARRFPQMEELHLSFAMSLNFKRQVVQLLEDRAEISSGAIKILYMADPRPPEEGEEGAVAAALESLIPRVVWNHTRQRQRRVS
ncbi:unnamed protein product [Peniophora sp. CBMAI 1063]|nr:unnamed protein product [Peniophora sp. CBMAI 1063]